MLDKQIETFFSSQEFAVVGASCDRIKYGNKVLRCYMQKNLVVHPVHPTQKIIEGLSVCRSLTDLPNQVQSISIITPPQVTEDVIAEAIKKGIKNIWIQPGAESKKAIALCIKQQINVIAQGPCILVKLGYHEEIRQSPL